MGRKAGEHFAARVNYSFTLAAKTQFYYGIMVWAFTHIGKLHKNSGSKNEAVIRDQRRLMVKKVWRGLLFRMTVF